MMRYAWAILGLGLLTVASGETLGQGAPPASPSPVELKQNYPNPFNPATTIPFSLNGDLFANGHHPKVSLKIYNVLAQHVATPILQGPGQPLDQVELYCGNPSGCTFNAYWDGKVANGQEAASGIYIYQLIVDGRRFTKKMIVMK